MKHRKLQIAWSVAWGAVAVFVCVLWVRSYLRMDALTHVDRSGISRTVGLTSGTIYFARLAEDKVFKAAGWHFTSDETEPLNPKLSYTAGKDRMYRVPISLLTFPTAVLAALPWFPSRFSLRTLLIVTTFVAGMLGLIVWTSR